MRKLCILIMFASLMLSTKAFASDKLTPNLVEKIPGVMDITVKEINDKVSRKKFDILISLKNTSDQPLLIFMGEMHCSKGGVEGKLGHAFFGLGEQAMDLKLGQTKEFRYVCSFTQKIKTGDFELYFGQVYSNPSNDGKTTDKVLTKSMKVVVPGI